MSKKYVILSVAIVLTFLFTLLPACRPSVAATGYTAIVPAILQAGSKEIISVNLFDVGKDATGKVRLILLKDGKEITQTEATIEGKGELEMNIPDIAGGEYTLQFKTDNFEDEARVSVRNDSLVFLETDKPIYKPGQTIHMRLISLDPDLKPLQAKIVVEVMDAKGIKIFRREISTGEFGMASLDLPVSQEPNLGAWKITATTPTAKTEQDIRVEEYVLPKYEVSVDLPKDWFLVSEPIKGKVSANYSYGKPVRGELQIVATKYVGTWQDYATLNIDIDGETDFTLPPAQYVAGVPSAGGMGNVKLTCTVVEKSTGYEEKSDTLITVTQSSTIIEIIPSGSSFKPGLPYSLLIVTKTPDNKLIDTNVKTTLTYFDDDFQQISIENKNLNTEKGKALLEINPPSRAVALTIESSTGTSQIFKTIEAAYSPSGNFIHLEQTSAPVARIGDNIRFFVYSSQEAKHFYFEVIARGKVIFSDYSSSNDITFQTTPAMAPSARLLVYQILPNAEVAADYLPFEVPASYPQQVTIKPSATEGEPGDETTISVQTEGEAQIGLVAVDKSVFILAESRTNLEQVFDDLERLYMDPQAELHEVSIYEGVENRGAKDVFKDAGVVVLSNIRIPEGKEIKTQWGRAGGNLEFAVEDAMGGKALPPAMAPVATQTPSSPASNAGPGLAEVQRVRQFFPETWIWDTFQTGRDGKGSFKANLPDTITTWMVRAVALSKSKGLGVAESQITVFQPFFLTVDLPYSAIRGEVFPVRVAVYNYLDQTQNVTVEIQPDEWFDLLDNSQKTIEIKANDIGSVEFEIRPTELGTNGVNINARSLQSADAMIKTIIIEPEGIPREIVDNFSLVDGSVKQLSTSIPGQVVEGSGRAIITLTSSYLTQTIDGLETLLQMPFGCGEQNMIVFAPDVYITRYLQESGQLKPEIMAKAEKLMLTGYQRELTYMRKDGSFSAFGENDEEGSLWLTAFVLKCFSEAKDLIYVDSNVINSAKSWILSHQNGDGSFDAVGFVHHQEMLGGLKGKNALTAYVAIALAKAGDSTGSARAISYLETKLAETDDPYTVALMGYAFETVDSPQAMLAYEKLLILALEDENGLHWGSDTPVMPFESDSLQPGLRMPVSPEAQTSAIENTGYATLALALHGDALNASRAAKWLVSKRNAYGGYGSTQDTVVALQALIEQAAGTRADVDLSIEIKYQDTIKTVKIQPDNFDILQTIEIPTDRDITIQVIGKGEAIGQLVRRFNLSQASQAQDDTLKINVDYDTSQVAVNDVVKVSVDVAFNPPVHIEAGMVVIDISVPTGFAAVRESIDNAVQGEEKIKRFDVSGRKVIFYVENMLPGDKVSFEFMVQALYPVKAKGVTSIAYSYYMPEISGESLSQEMTINN